MQTLGLASEPKPTDGFVKRLLWPTIENEYDADLVSQQGLWVCTAVGVLSLVMSLLAGSPLIGLLIAVTYWLGGCGVRERSFAAALLVFICFLGDKLISIEAGVVGVPGGGGGNPLMGIVTLGLLFANVRATLLSRRWSKEHSQDETGERPERLTDSMGDKFSNVLPAKIWPVARFVFFPLAGVLLLLTLLSGIGLPFVKTAQRTPPASVTVYPSPR